MGPIVLAKYPAGARPEDGWIYEPEPCPGCYGWGQVPIATRDSARPWIVHEGEVDCGLCGGSGAVFEDGQYDREAARALWMKANGKTDELEELTVEATLKLAELRDEMW